MKPGATQLAEQVRTGQISSVKLTSESLRRIREHDGAIHSVVEVWPERALRQARKSSPKDGPLAGVPTLIKDLSAVRFSRMQMGSRAMQRFYTPVDDLVVARLRRAGLIFLGKATTSEFGVLPITEPQTHQATRNPFQTEFTAGGSSGGPAAAVAAGFVPSRLRRTRVDPNSVLVLRLGGFEAVTRTGDQPVRHGLPSFDLDLWTHCSKRDRRRAAVGCSD